MSNVTVADLDKLIEKLVAKESEIAVIEDTLKTHNKEYNTIVFQIAAHLKDLGREEYDHPSGKFGFKETWRVNLPESDIDKKVFFEHLRERGIFDKYATINSNSLQALYRADWEDAKTRGEGMLFNMPGIPAPKYEVKPNFKLKKGRKNAE